MKRFYTLLILFLGVLSSLMAHDAEVNGIYYNLDTTNQFLEDKDGGIRYFGANPNNYVYFNCDSYPDTECETWRIIGVFDEKIKIMRKIFGCCGHDCSRCITYLATKLPAFLA